MKVALVMNKNSYAGREYLSALQEAGIIVDALTIGEYPEVTSINEERCSGLWSPPPESKLKAKTDFYHFKSLKDVAFLNFLQEKSYDIGIQGGTGILQSAVIDLFSHGMLNFHPGLLPQYRGCSAPEWQLYHGELVYCTCHFVDEGIDTGDICYTKELKVDRGSYAAFRASIYPEIASFVVDVVTEFITHQKLPSKEQDEGDACYYQYIGEEKIMELRRLLS